MEEFAATWSGGVDDLVVQFTGSMTIHHAEEIKTALLEALGKASKITCNIELVSGIDLAGLQLLCATHRAAAGSGKQFEVLGLEREEMRNVVVGAGFARHVGCMNDENNRCLWVGGDK
mgnify:CR=1 FL=1